MITAQYSMTPSVTQFQAVELQERGQVTDIFRLKYESFNIVQEEVQNFPGKIQRNRCVRKKLRRQCWKSRK